MPVLLCSLDWSANGILGHISASRGLGLQGCNYHSRLFGLFGLGKWLSGWFETKSPVCVLNFIFTNFKNLVHVYVIDSICLVLLPLTLPRATPNPSQIYDFPLIKKKCLKCSLFCLGVCGCEESCWGTGTIQGPHILRKLTLPPCHVLPEKKFLLIYWLIEFFPNVLGGLAPSLCL